MKGDLIRFTNSSPVGPCWVRSDFVVAVLPQRSDVGSIIVLKRQKTQIIVRESPEDVIVALFEVTV